MYILGIYCTAQTDDPEKYPSLLLAPFALLTPPLSPPMNKLFFANKIHLFANFRRFFAKWGLFFAKWGLLFARLYARKSPTVLLNLGHPIAPLHFVCAI